MQRLEQTASILEAFFVSNKSIQAEDVPSLVKSVFESLPADRPMQHNIVENSNEDAAPDSDVSNEDTDETDEVEAQNDEDAIPA